MADLGSAGWAGVGAIVAGGVLKLLDKLLGHRFDEAAAIRIEIREERDHLQRQIDELRDQITYWRNLYHAERELRIAAEARLVAVLEDEEEAG